MVKWVPADTVFISIGDVPDTDFLPDNVAVERGYVVVDDNYQTSNPKVFAIGDVVRQGLLTDAIGHGRRAVEAIDAIVQGKRPTAQPLQIIDINRVSLEYYDPRVVTYEDLDHCGSQCASCGQCRDCGICVAACPENAISRVETKAGEFEYQVDGDRLHWLRLLRRRLSLRYLGFNGKCALGLIQFNNRHSISSAWLV